MYADVSVANVRLPAVRGIRARTVRGTKKEGRMMEFVRSTGPPAAAAAGSYPVYRVPHLPKPSTYFLSSHVLNFTQDLYLWMRWGRVEAYIVYVLDLGVGVSSCRHFVNKGNNSKILMLNLYKVVNEVGFGFFLFWNFPSRC